MPPDPPVDPGLQQERTALAWRRTGLALVVGVLTVGRLSMEALGAIVVLPAVLALTAALWVVAASLRRGRFAATSGVEAGFRDVLRDGRLPAAMALVVLVLCAVELVTALSGAFPQIHLEIRSP